ncbi:hypothetical protein AVEN_148751-1, partial [Araneus ventricosus]
MTRTTPELAPPVNFRATPEPVHPRGLKTLWVSRWTWVVGTARARGCLDLY